MYVVLFARGTQKEVDNQLSRLREVARRQHWFVVGQCFDVLSGRRNDRRGFLQMLKDIQKGGIQAIVVTRHDRLGFSPRLLVDTAPPGPTWNGPWRSNKLHGRGLHPGCGLGCARNGLT